MPTLDWIGKKAVEKHHEEVPFHLLKCDNSLSVGDPGSGNLIVQGDNLLALKALLPYYAGKVKCIYIDPPYNTGNENWVYNDNVNSPEIREWLGKVVGSEAEDLSRHDKWLCMMLPRLALLRRFLREDGLIFISLDDNEAVHLKAIMDMDVAFGRRTFVQQIVWKNKYGPGAMTRGFGNIHEYVFCYSKTPLDSIEASLSGEEEAKYKLRDDKFDVRGGYITQPLATRSKDDRPNLVYPVRYNGEDIWPDKQWIWAKERMEEAVAKNEVVFRKSGGKWSVRFKQYLRDENGQLRMAKPISIMSGPFNQEGTAEIEEIFGSKVFSNPKPTALVRYLAAMIVNGSHEKDYIVMDSFAGSGTTAHAVLQLNKEDGGNRKFILVEMEEKICREITAERVKRVAQGYTNSKGKFVEGLGGGFRYCTLGDTLFDADGQIRKSVSFSDLARHIFLTETGEPLPKQNNGRTPLLGVVNGTAYYLLYNGILSDKRANGGNVLTRAVLADLPSHDGPRVIFGTGCRIGDARLKREQITFKQVPYQIKVR